jgi:N-acetylneuraminic acid mutarotase
MGATAAVVNNRIIVIGGNLPPNGSLAVEEYDPATNTWAVLTPMPSGRHSPAIGVINGKVYVCGGWGGSVLNTLLEYDRAGNSWTAKTPMTTAREHVFGAVVSGKFYVIGGGVGAASWYPDNEMYDPVGNAWTTKTPMSVARQYALAVAVNGKIYVIGGNVSGGALTPTVEEYDPVGNAWTTKTPMPIARDRAAGAALDGKIYVLGGAWTNVVQVYDVAGDSWTTHTASAMGTDNDDATGAAVNGRLYLIGGNNTGYVGQANVYEGYVPGSSSTDPPPDTGLVNPPAAGKIQIRRAIIRMKEGGQALIVVRGKTPGGTVTLNLYNQSGMPIGRIGNPVILGADATATVSFDGTLDGKVLPSGLYYVISSGEVSDRKSVMVISDKGRL